RPLHRVRELFLLLVELCVVDCERCLSRNRLCTLDLLYGYGFIRAKRQDRQRGEHLRRSRNRHHCARPATLQERHQRSRRSAEPVERLTRELERLAESKQTLDRLRAERKRRSDDQL